LAKIAKMTEFGAAKFRRLSKKAKNVHKCTQVGKSNAKREFGHTPLRHEETSRQKSPFLAIFGDFAIFVIFAKIACQAGISLLEIPEDFHLRISENRAKNREKSAKIALFSRFLRLAKIAKALRHVRFLRFLKNRKNREKSDFFAIFWNKKSRKNHLFSRFCP